MEKTQLQKLLIPVLAGAALLGLILFMIIGPNPEEKKLNSGDPTPPSAEPQRETQKSKDRSAEGMAKEYPADTDEGYTLLTGGLKYKDLKVGEGEEAPSGCFVNCHYAGWQTNGFLFDSSYLKRSEPSGFSLNQVIRGWTVGIPGMKPGGIRRLIIPPDMAYGAGGGGKPGGTLVFEIKLLDWK